MEKDFYAEYFELEDRHWWFVGRREILLDVLRRRLGDSPERLEILDVGCGTGTMLGYLAEFGSPQGMDADEEAIRFCRRRGVTDVRHVPAGEWPFADASFDLLTALDVVEHIEDDVSALAQMRRVLKPGGTLLLAVPAMPALWGNQDEISHHFRRYTAPELRSRISSAGFVVRRLTYFNTLLFPGIAAVRLFRRARGRTGAVKSDFSMTDPRSRTNRILARAFAAEAAALRRRDLPFGVSLLALAEAPAVVSTHPRA